MLQIAERSNGATTQSTAQSTTPPTTTKSPSPSTTDLPSDERGDLLVRGLWNKSTDCIIDVRLTDTDQPTYLTKSPSEVLELHEKEKKNKYAKKCLEQRRTFTPFVISVDGMMGKEAHAVLKHLAHLYVDKWDLTYSKVRGYINAQISLACLRSAHRCLRGSRVPTTHICRSHLHIDRPWEDGAGFSLVQH